MKTTRETTQPAKRKPTAKTGTGTNESNDKAVPEPDKSLEKQTDAANPIRPVRTGRAPGRKKAAVLPSGRDSPDSMEFAAMDGQGTRALAGADFVIEKLRLVAERSLAAVPVVNSRGEETGVWQFNAAAATKALELMGKLLGMFGDKGSGAVQAVPGVELVLHTGHGGENGDGDNDEAGQDAEDQGTGSRGDAPAL